MRFHAFLGEDATVGEVNEGTGFGYLAHLRHSDLSDNRIATCIKCLKAFTDWMSKKAGPSATVSRT
jgi:hypothetical protein